MIWGQKDIYTVACKFIPHKANLRQQRHPTSIHHKLKRHELLECLVQFQKVMKLTENQCL